MNQLTHLARQKGTTRLRSTLYWSLAHALLLARRQLTQIRRQPDQLIFATLQPVFLTLLFRYVFGGAIAVSGTSYANFLMAGIFVEAALTSSLSTGFGLSTDLARGLIDRFRSLPMAQSAVLTGRTLADLTRNGFVVLVMGAVGLLVGFRPAGNPLAWLAATGLILLTCFAFSWLSAVPGLLLSSSEAVQSASLILLYPLLLASNAFVPTSTMPLVLRVFAEHQPVSVVIGAVRGLLLDRPDVPSIWQAIAWLLGLLVISIPLALLAYGHRTAR